MQRHMAKKYNIARKFNKVQNTLGNFEDAAKEKLETFRGGVKFTKKAARSVDRYSHKNPWMVVGAFSFFALFFGYLFGMKRMYSYYK